VLEIKNQKHGHTNVSDFKISSIFSKIEFFSVFLLTAPFFMGWAGFCSNALWAADTVASND